MFKNSLAVAVVLTAVLLVFAGTARAGLTPFLITEDFNGTAGWDLTAKAWWEDNVGLITLSSTVIDVGNSGALPGGGDYWVYGKSVPGADLMPGDMDAGQQAIVTAYVEFVGSMTSGDWARFGLVNGVEAGPNVGIQATGDGSTQDIWPVP